jgi:hypothetical protein
MLNSIARPTLSSRLGVGGILLIAVVIVLGGFLAVFNFTSFF